MTDTLAETQPVQPTAAPVTAEPAPAATPVAPVNTPTNDRNPKWFDDRMGEMTARFHQERLAREDLERKLQASQVPKEVEKPKTLADFEYDDSKYQTYLFAETEKRAEAVARRVRAEEQEQVSTERRARKFKEREVSFEKETPDYREVAHYAPISDEMAMVIQELESGPDIAYYLGKNKDIALHLVDLPPRIAAVELGRIDAKLTAEKAAKAAALEAAKAAKAVTQAPPPTPQIDGASHTVDKDPSKMTDKEYAAWRKKQISARRIS